MVLVLLIDTTSQFSLFDPAIESVYALPSEISAFIDRLCVSFSSSSSSYLFPAFS